MSNILDPASDFGPDIDPECLLFLSVDEKSRSWKANS